MRSFTILYSSPNTNRVIQSREMRRTGHVTRTGEKRNAYRVLMWKPAGGYDVGVTEIDGIILSETLKEQNGMVRTVLN